MVSGYKFTSQSVSTMNMHAQNLLPARLRVHGVKGMAFGRLSLAQSESVSQYGGPSWACYFVVRCQHGLPFGVLASFNQCWVHSIAPPEVATHVHGANDSAG